MQSSRVLGVVSAAVLVLLGACKDDDDTPPTAKFAHDYCEIHEGFCCTKSGKTYDGGTCEAFLVLASLEASFNQGAADTCIAALRAAQGSATFCTDHGGADVTAKCDAVYTQTGGSVAAGGACKSDSSCAAVPNGEAACINPSQDFESNARICQAQNRAPEGADCGGDHYKLSNISSTVTQSRDAQVNICWEEDGLYCDAKTKKCTRKAAVGEKCDSSQSCAAGAYCGYGSDTTTFENECIALGKLDEPCSSTYTTSCETGLHCDSVSRKCATDVPLGGACDSNQPSACGNSASCQDGVCKGSSLGFSLFCQ